MHGEGAVAKSAPQEHRPSRLAHRDRSRLWTTHDEGACHAWSFLLSSSLSITVVDEEEGASFAAAHADHHVAGLHISMHGADLVELLDAVEHLDAHAEDARVREGPRRLPLQTHQVRPTQSDDDEAVSSSSTLSFTYS